MQYYSIYDILLKKIEKTGMAIEEMYAFFRTRKIRKADLTELQQTSYIPSNPDFITAVCEFLDMSELEISLLMGRIPPEYRTSYFQNIKSIAALLTVEKHSQPVHPEVFFETDLGKLYNGDCITVMRSLPDACVDLVFADPPFNLGKTYDAGVDDNKTMSEYLSWTYAWLDECVRILKPGGRIFVYNLPKWCVYIASHLQETMTFWHWIAVDMKFSLPIQSRLYPSHYALVSFTKGTKANTFHNQRSPLQTCRHCGGEIKDYGGYKSKMNPSGVNISDVWTDIYPVRHKSSKKRKYNELSVKLLERVIDMSTEEGDTVFDPFGGSGTTFAVAQLMKRRWLGTELGDCEIIKRRILSPAQDQEQLEKIQRDKKCLFPPAVEMLRKKNGFWIYSDFAEEKANEDQDVQT